MNQKEQSNFDRLGKLFSEEKPQISINIDYPIIHSILQNFSQDFIQDYFF